MLVLLRDNYIRKRFVGLNMDIEKLATSAVQDSISKTDVLSACINDGDKEPSWDGNIYIYNNSNKTKEGIKKVPVQIKGKICNKQSKSIIKYPVSISDLNNYRNDGGTLFFVVYVSKDGEKKKIYYNSLLPVKIRSLLKNTRNLKTKNIEFREFPTNKDKKVEILLNCYNDRIKQTSYANSELQSLEEVEKSGFLESLSLSYIPYGVRADSNSFLDQDDLYLYAKLKGHNTLVPVDTMISNLSKMIEINQEVSSGGIKYYSSFRQIKSREYTEYLIGESFKMVFPKNKKNIKTAITITDNVQHAIEDLKFIITVYNNQEMCIAGNVIPMERDVVFKDFDVELYQKALNSFEKISELLCKFHLSNNVSVKDMTKQDSNNTEMLIRGIIDKERVKLNDKNMPTCIKLDYFGKKIALWFEKSEDGNYRVYDYFEAPFALFYTDENDRQLQTSKYDLLKANDYLEIHNLPFEKLIDSYVSLDSDNIRSRLNLCMLELIKAYDVSSGRRKDLLLQAKRIQEYFDNDITSQEEIGENIRLINRLQIKKRETRLSKKDKRMLFDIIDSVEAGNDIKTAAYILLDDEIHAEKHFNSMNKDEQNGFMTYPIYDLWDREVLIEDGGEQDA